MRIYKHIGKGHYIGSCIVIIAEDEDIAKHLISIELINMGLRDEPLDIEEFEIIKNTIIVKQDGDY